MVVSPTARTALAVVLDANVLIAECSQEPDSYPVAHAQLLLYAQSGARLFAPGVMVGESLFALCRKLADGVLTPAEYAQAIQALVGYLRVILPPPGGDGALAARAEALRGPYGCSRSADRLYLALAEDLTQAGPAELVTFDSDLHQQAAAMCPAVSIRLLQR